MGFAKYFEDNNEIILERMRNRPIQNAYNEATILRYPNGYVTRDKMKEISEDSIRKTHPRQVLFGSETV